MKYLIALFCLVVACGIDELYDAIYNRLTWTDVTAIGIVTFAALFIYTVKNAQSGGR